MIENPPPGESPKRRSGPRLRRITAAKTGEAPVTTKYPVPRPPVEQSRLPSGANGRLWVRFGQVLQDTPRFVGILVDRKDSHLGTALWRNQRISFICLTRKACPSTFASTDVDFFLTRSRRFVAADELQALRRDVLGQLDEQVDYSTPEEFTYRIEPRERDVEEGASSYRTNCLLRRC